MVLETTKTEPTRGSWEYAAVKCKRQHGLFKERGGAHWNTCQVNSTQTTNHMVLPGVAVSSVDEATNMVPHIRWHLHMNTYQATLFDL